MMAFVPVPLLFVDGILSDKFLVSDDLALCFKVINGDSVLNIIENSYREKKIKKKKERKRKAPERISCRVPIQLWVRNFWHLWRASDRWVRTDVYSLVDRSPSAEYERRGTDCSEHLILGTEMKSHLTKCVTPNENQINRDVDGLKRAEWCTCVSVPDGFKNEMIQEGRYCTEITESERLLVFVHFKIIQHPIMDEYNWINIQIIHPFKPTFF